jgi:hypothetical protein
VEETVSAVLDPRALEEQIARIREKESNPYSSGTKTNLFTLLVFRAGDAPAPGSSVPGTPDHVDTALQYLLGKRPARIITLRRSHDVKTDAWVSGRCSPDKRNRGVCFEEVCIECGDDGVGGDPGTWSPLVIRDLPVFAWLPDSLEAASGQWSSSLRGASGLIDKVLVDSSRSPGDTAATLDELRRLMKETADASSVSDFSWRRSRVLREQTARAFDPAELRLLLPAVRAVQLYGGSRIEARLFFEWLGSRLGREVAVDHAWEGPLTEGFRVTFTIDGAPVVDIGCTRGGCLSRGEEKGAYRFPSDGEILLEEVDSLGRDAVFAQVLLRAHTARA